jgi:flagellar motor protein MotB
MNDNRAFAATGEETTPLTATMRSLLNRLTLARATELARAGRYGEAEKVLAASEAETESTPAALDLLARMRAQQGHLSDAEKLWMRASQLDPANTIYPASLQRAAALQQRSRGLRIVLPLAACLVLIAMGFTGWWLRWRNAKPVQISSIQPTPSQVASPSSQEGSVPRPTTVIEDSEQTGVPPIENAINVQGVTLTKVSGLLHISFDEGLFERGMILTPDARKRLTQLGRQLKPYAVSSTIEIVGMTDDLPVRRNFRYPDNASLGIERARIVYDFLRFTSGLDSQIFTISSSEKQLAPPPDGTLINRARNRTVVLQISIRQR